MAVIDTSTALSFFMGFLKVFGSLFLLFSMALGGLFYAKQRKFRYPVHIITSFGNGKVGIITKKCGWFKSEKSFFKLLDLKGERRLETNDKRLIQKGNSENFQMINFKRGLLVREKQDDPKILVPLGDINLDEKSNDLLMTIAPPHLRDASSNILKENSKELESSMDKFLGVVLTGLGIIAMFVSVVMVIQFAKTNMAEASALYEQAMAFYEKSLNSLATSKGASP